MKSKKWLIIGVIVGVVLLGLIFWGIKVNKYRTSGDIGVDFTASSTYFANHFTDVVGTHVATTTVGEAFLGGATSTYITYIGYNVNTASYMITLTDVVSSTDNFVTFYVEGSNDAFCSTASSTATSSAVVDFSDINWFSAGDHLNNKVHATSFSNASSTQYITWTNANVGFGQEILLTNLNYRCLRLGVSAASTTIWVGLGTK